MPEGDTIARAAATLRARIGGRAVSTARPATLARLSGRRLLGVDTVGKHLYLRFDGPLVLHTHMRMTGSWHVYARDERWRHGTHRATAVLDFADVVAVLFAAPTCELIDESRVGEGLGPDILADSFDEAGVLSRARASHQATVAELLLDQTVCAGIGNIHRCNALWREGIQPLTAPADLDDTALARVYRRARDLMRRAVVADAFRVQSGVHGRAGRPCPACATRIGAQSIGDPARIVFWCPRCQALGHDGPVTRQAAPRR